MSDIKGAGKVWHKGPPPHVGWWPASVNRSTELLRWWNGRTWSPSISMYADSRAAADVATLDSCLQLNRTEWRDRPKDWP